MLKQLVDELLGVRAARAGAPAPASLAEAYDLLRQRDYAGALAVCEEFIARAPGAAEPWGLMGAIALERGEQELACVRFEKALEFAPGRLQALCNAAEANRQAGRHARALELCERALAQDAEHAPALLIKALVLRSCWRMQDALAIYRRLVQQGHDSAQACAGYLFLLLLLGEDPLQVRAEHVRGAQFHAAPDLELRAAVAPDPLRRLRIGYVSADFHDHAASSFVEIGRAHV
jgi:protein O-GlcNAc transferase